MSSTPHLSHPAPTVRDLPPVPGLGGRPESGAPLSAPSAGGPSGTGARAAATPEKDRRMLDLQRALRSSCGMVALASSEERRVLKLLDGWIKVDSQLRYKKVLHWRCTTGLVPFVDRDELPKEDPHTKTLLGALDHIMKMGVSGSDGALVVMSDVHHYLGDPDVLRRLRDAALWLRGTPHTAVLLSPTVELPEDLQHEVLTAEFPLPTKAELHGHAERMLRAYIRSRGGPLAAAFKDAADPEALRARAAFAAIVQEVASALQGLTELEAEDACVRGLVDAQGVNAGIVESIIRFKRQAIKRAGALEAIDVEAGLESAGGLSALKEWVRKRRRAFTDEARAFGVDLPKGVLLSGVPGTGKSLAAKAIAAEFKFPLFRLDLSAVYQGLVGASESNMRQALRIAEAMAPCVLHVDELEKGLSGLSGSGETNGGTSARVFGYFLTWLQEKTAPVFVVATANDLSALPSELLRKGRFDELFFLDLPTEVERAEILAVHLRKRGRNPDAFDLTEPVASSVGFVGAEIEAAVAEAVMDAFAEQDEHPDVRDVSVRHLLRAFEATTPMVKSQREKIDHLRRTAATRRMVRASGGATLPLPDDFFDAPDVPRF